MKSMIVKVATASLLLLFLAPWNPVSGAPADTPTTVQLVTAGAVTSPPTIDYRWRDIAQNDYAQTYRENYVYADANVSVTYQASAEPTFIGHLSATGLKPNFAYQIKIVGKPTGLFTVEQGGDDAANERIGYVGRWWEVAPSYGNRDDTYYEAHKNDPAYIFEAYLLFDFFLTDRFGAAEIDFALDSSYHVLFWDWQRTAGACDNPLKTGPVEGYAGDPAYSQDITATTVGVYPQIERLCDGESSLPTGTYNCRILLTEESFHSGYGNWAPAMICDDLQFDIVAGLIPPSLGTEPAFTAGAANTLSWATTAGASQYLVQCATDAAFTSIVAESGWISGTAHEFGGLADGSTYHYRVKAGDGLGTESGFSAATSSTQDATAPLSALGTLATTITTSSFDIPFTASDATSGIDFVRLFYRVDAGAWTQFDGPYESGPIEFNAGGDGVYDFYCVATDNAGNVEAAPGSPDASTTVDTSAGEPVVQGVVLAGVDSGASYPQDLQVSYYLTGSATSAATAWYRDGAPVMQLYLPFEGDGPAALKNYAYAGSPVAVADGDPQWVADAGHDGHGAFVYDGVDALAADDCQPTGSSYTKTVWVRLDGNGPGGGNAVLCGSADVGGHALWAPDARGYRLGSGHDGSWSTVEDPTPLALGVWTFAAVTYDATADLMILYRDGVEVDRATVATGTTDATTFVGSRGPAAGQNWVGAIDDVRIYAHALSPEQIAILCGAGGRDRIAAAETELSEVWQAEVTPFSDLVAGTTIASNTLSLSATESSITDSYVDIGNPASESGHAMSGWGPVEPDTHIGGWGGIGSESPPGKCRTIWSPEEAAPVGRWASLAIDFGPSATISKCLSVRYLDGGSDDSYDIYIDDDHFNYIYAPPGDETWRWVIMDVTGFSGVHTIRFEATGDPGTYYTPFGQVGIDKIHIGSRIDPVPVNDDPEIVEGMDCGQSQTVGFHFNLDCGVEAVRGYTVRFKCPDDQTALSFASGDIAVAVLPAGLAVGEYETQIYQEPGAGPNDWTVEYLIPGDTSGIPADVDLFTVTVHGDQEGSGILLVESVILEPLSGGPSLPVGRGSAELTVDCSPPSGQMSINDGAAATGLLTVNLVSEVADLTALEMRFSNDGGWGAVENAWQPYEADFAWDLAAGGEGARTVHAEYRDAIGYVLAVQDQIDYDITGLDPVTGITALAGHAKIDLAWNYSGDPANAVEIWRGMWYGDASADSSVSAYPEYDDLPADFIPVRPVDRAAAAAGGSGWDLVATVGSATTSWQDFPNPPAGLRRGIYYYEIFVSDTIGGYSDRATDNAWAHSYLPGDFGLPDAPHGWDGAISLSPDINTFSLCYGAAEADASYNADCDIGPTDDFGGMGIPGTDNVIDFADLMIIAQNYDSVLAKLMPAAGGPTAVMGWREIAAGVWSLRLIEPCRDLKGLRLSSDSPGLSATVAAGELLKSQAGPCFVQNIPGRGLDAGLALLGGGMSITGAGELLRVDLGAGVDPADLRIDVRDSANRPIEFRIDVDAGTPANPAASWMGLNHPNPFNPATTIEFALTAPQRVRLTVFTVDGGRVATLVDAEFPAGTHQTAWDGRNDRGRTMPSGVYFYLIEAGDLKQARKMTLLR